VSDNRDESLAHTRAGKNQWFFSKKILVFWFLWFLMVFWFFNLTGILAGAATPTIIHDSMSL
jgi:cytoskeletal protein RodZ